MTHAQSPYGAPPPPQGSGGYGVPPAPGGYGPPAAAFSPPPAGSFGHGGYGGPSPPRTDSLGVAGLVLSVLGLVGAILNMLSGLMGACCFLCTLGSTVLGVLILIPSGAGIIMGAMSVSRINKTPNVLTGKGLALAAVIVGLIAAILALAEIVLPWLGIAFFAITSSGAGP